ncbi:MAG: glycosyltransferase, partial [Bacteroidia bacterium]|nr:glycosyltransferase [Bacteroidia bacterium]
VGYLKSRAAVVVTSHESKLSKLIQQRLRWASKTTAYKNAFGKLLAIIVALMNAMILIGFVLVLLNRLSFSVFISIFSLKVVIDFWLIFKSAQLYDQKKSLIYYPISSICYPIFAVFIAIYSMFSKYNWKGRSFSK